MSHTVIPQGYTSRLTCYGKQEAISFIKQHFLSDLCRHLSLMRVSAPLFVSKSSGLNDNLSGTERPVSFDTPACDGAVEVVHSLAKWKRVALLRYGFPVGEGLCTDMNAIRRDEEPDNLHSIYVDQWDWEKVITKADRTLDYLKATVREIVSAVCETARALHGAFPQLSADFDENVAFVTAQELEDLFPALTPDERENAFVREHRTACVMQIGGKLRSGIRHGMRAPDYDDWALNCDIFFWSDVLGRAVEISSMGIRVDADALARQLSDAGCEDRATLPYHKALAAGELPLTIGGGIGQSRLCLLLLECAHVGEVQVSLWDKETFDTCRANGIDLL